MKWQHRRRRKKIKKIKKITRDRATATFCGSFASWHCLALSLISEQPDQSFGVSFTCGSVSRFSSSLGCIATISPHAPHAPHAPPPPLTRQIRPIFLFFHPRRERHTLRERARIKREEHQAPAENRASKSSTSIKSGMVFYKHQRIKSYQSMKWRLR